MATPKLSSFHLESIVVDLPSLEDIALSFMEHTSRDMDPGSAQAFRNQCDAFIKDGFLQKLVESFVDRLRLVGGNAAAKDMQSRFAILFSLARHLPQESLVTVVPHIARVVVELPDKSGDLVSEDKIMRMNVLRNLYTVIDPRSPTRFGTLVTMLEYSQKKQVFDIFDGTTALDIEELSKLWNSNGSNNNAELAAEQKRTLFKMYSDLADIKLKVLGPSMSDKELRNDELKQHRFLTRLLDTFEASPEELPSAQKYAARAAVIAIKYPLPGDMAASTSLEEQNAATTGLKRGAVAILNAGQSKTSNWAGLTASASACANYAAVQFLSSVPEYKQIYQLLTIFAGHGLDELIVFQNENPQVLTSLGLDMESCNTNMRYLTLASLAANAEVVKYATIAKELQVKETEVERWVIDAITCKIIDAKMDQLNQSIVINRGSQRLLTQEQWVEVQGKLSQWKNSVRSLLDTVKSVRQEQQLLKEQQEQ